MPNKLLKKLYFSEMPVRTQCQIREGSERGCRVSKSSRSCSINSNCAKMYWIEIKSY